MTESLLNLLLIQANLILLFVLVTLARLLLKRGAIIVLAAIAVLLFLLPLLVQRSS